MSYAALCQVDVAAHFAADPLAASQPAPRASFDCANAKSPLEIAICSDISFGHADIVLSRVYTLLRQSRFDKKEDRGALTQSEKRWLLSVPAKCGLSATPASQKSLNCLRNEFELRFTDLDSCADSPDCGRSSFEAADDHPVAAESASNARASFDCEAPSRPLELVICADAELGQSDIKLAQAYRDAGTTMTGVQHKQLIDSERQWLRYVSGS